MTGCCEDVCIHAVLCFQYVCTHLYKYAGALHTWYDMKEYMYVKALSNCLFTCLSILSSCMNLSIYLHIEISIYYHT